MDTIQIRQATINDIRILQDIGRQTFSETFASSNSEANRQRANGDTGCSGTRD